MTRFDNAYEDALRTSRSSRDIAKEFGINKSTVNTHRALRGITVTARNQHATPAIVKRSENPDAPSTTEIPEDRTISSEFSTDGSFSTDWIRSRAVTIQDAEDWVRSAGKDPEDYSISVRSIAYGRDSWSNKLAANPKHVKGSAPLWPVIQPATAVNVHVEPRDTVTPVEGYKLSLKCADTQIGFRQHSDGSLEPFHDQQAMDLFTEVAAYHQPDSIVILGDFLDLASQGKFAQEAAFANTTQLALNAAHAWLATLRAACPDTIIIIIEGNHDARMQRFIEANALAAFGLKQANLPESWPVMSLPNLLRLDDLDIQYVDAYPAATFWDNAQTRNIHGTKVNSRGSTTSQYSNELPHINTWAGHTHRAEITYKTVMGEYGQAIESYAANPGVLCRVDGSVPSVNGAQHSDGTTARVVENWQQGFGTLYYNDTESIPQVYRIKDGKTMIAGTVFSA